MSKFALQDKIGEIKEYFSNIEIRDNLYIVKVYYPDKWKGYDSEDSLISVANNNDNSWFYYANVTEVDLYDIFELIKDTIRTNQEKEKRVELMKIKMLELKDLFSDMTIPLSSLETLTFTLGTEVKKTKRTTRKTSKKKEKTETKTEEKEAES